MMRRIGVVSAMFALAGLAAQTAAAECPMYSFKLVSSGTPVPNAQSAYVPPDASGTSVSYDESLAVACLQGLINRDRPTLYMTSAKDPNPQYWWDKLSGPGQWLAGKTLQPLTSIDDLVRLAGDRLKGAAIWDPEVPATVNVATTMAGVEDLVALSPEMAERCLSRWGLRVRHDLRGKFDGHETGSKKNDAYRWALREYLAKGMCSFRFLCLYEDSFFPRAGGDLSYVVTRDWAMKNRAFVFDLSPWGDEPPGDDPGQPIGADLGTYRTILKEAQKQARGRHLIEVGGGNVNHKYANLSDLPPSLDPILFLRRGFFAGPRRQSIVGENPTA